MPRDTALLSNPNVQERYFEQLVKHPPKMELPKNQGLITFDSWCQAFEVIREYFYLRHVSHHQYDVLFSQDDLSKGQKYIDGCYQINPINSSAKPGHSWRGSAS